MHTVLDLFSGIGGFSLGLERVGGGGYFETAAFCEDNEPCQRVLNKHWPEVKIYGDIKELTYEQLCADGVRPSVICGGWPCQDISTAGRGAGIVHGNRSSLWKEMLRLCRDVHPTWLIAENVSALRSKGLSLVIKDLCEIGYVGEFHCIPASTGCGAPHQRDRIWIVAHPDLQAPQAGQREDSYVAEESGGGSLEHRRCSEYDARNGAIRREGGAAEPHPFVAHPAGQRPQGQGEPVQSCHSAQIITRQTVESFNGRVSDFWAVEPPVGRVANGIPGRVDRLKQLGNSVVPQIPQMIGEAIMEYEQRSAGAGRDQMAAQPGGPACLS